MSESNSTPADDFAEKLCTLTPARSGIDSREVFYRAGFEACRAQFMQQQSSLDGSRPSYSGTLLKQQLRFRVSRVSLVALGSAAMMCVAIPASYLIGRSSALSDASGVARVERVEQSQLVLPMDPRLADALVVESPSTSMVKSLNSESLPTSETTLRQRSQVVMLAPWIHPLSQLAATTKLDRQSEPTLRSSHASTFLLDSSMRSLSELPVTLTSLSPHSAAENAITEGSSNQTTTLSARDLRMFTLDMRAL